MSLRSIPPTVARKRATVAALHRYRPEGDPELVDARRDLAAANIAEYVRKVVSAAPPLTAEQRDVIMSAFSGFNPAARAGAE